MSTTTTTIECPRCFAAMRRVERSGVVIDRCTNCGGVFLDRGELQALINAESTYDRSDDDDDDYDDDDYQDRGRKRTSRRSFLEELFDFG